MPEIEFEIDQETGELRSHITGIAGPACDDVARLLKELAGEPAREELTPEYHLRPQIQPRIRPGGAGRERP